MTLERPNIAKMQGYAPGEQPADQGTIKLNTNENPYPPSPAVAQALAAIDSAALRRYPPPMAAGFREAAALLHGVTAANIIPTNGGDELLRLAITTFADPGDSIVVSKPSYSLYPVLADVQGCKLREIPLQDNWQPPADFLAQARKANAKMIILVNPHAPSGTLLSVDYLSAIAQAFDGLLLVDEAYVNFIEPAEKYDAIPLIRQFENILLLRTLSKGYSLAGLRFGYGIGPEAVINPMLLKTRDSYNTDYIAQKLATAAIKSVDYATDNWARVREQRQWLQQALAAIGLDSASSQSNFLLTTIPDSPGAESLYKALKSRKILVRYFDQERLRNRLRITVGTAEENQALVTALKQILQPG